MHRYATEKSADLTYRLRALGTSAALLHVAAHPDDEDIGILAYYSRKFGIRSVYWSATRGESGQNRIGEHHGEALGIYRTWESVAARQEDGGECLFGPFYDFGYSKTGDEAIAKWGWDNLVREIVRAIRMTQPQVVVSRWHGAPQDFHGHHQGVGRAVYEAFDAAGDENRFPELTRSGLAPWAPVKLFLSLDNTGGDLTVGGAANIFGRANAALERPGVVRINTGEFDAIAGASYQERAWRAYNRHQTQAMGLVPQPGDFFYYFELANSRVPGRDHEADLFDGIDVSLAALADYPGEGSAMLREHLERITAACADASAEYRPDAPAAAGVELLEAADGIRDLIGHVPDLALPQAGARAIALALERKLHEVEDVAGRCLGLELQAVSERPRLIPGESVTVQARLWSHGGIALDAAEISLPLPEGWSAAGGDPSSLEPATGRSVLSQRFEVTAAPSVSLSSPYWLIKPRTGLTYHWPDDDPCAGLPFAPPPAQAGAKVELHGHTLTLKAPVVHRRAFPGGYQELPLAIVPPIELTCKARRLFRRISDAAQEVELLVVARNRTDHALEARLELLVPEGWSARPAALDLNFARAGETRTVKHSVTLPPHAAAGAYPLRYSVTCMAQESGVIVSPVRMPAPGIPGPVDESNCIEEELIIEPAIVALHLIESKFITSLRYAYVEGVKESLLEAMLPFGLAFHLISDDEMGYVDLSQFDAIVVGPNAYLRREALVRYASRFLEYVQRGGTLIVQYQGYAYQKPGLAPYSFKYSTPHDRVTDETAEVRFLEPDHLLFRVPNLVTSEAFDGWVHDRGLYFFGEWDERYHALLSSNDQGEDPKGGGLIECQYGRGTYIYLGYSLFRQVPMGVPGAFALLANVLALPEARILERIEFLRKIPLLAELSHEQLDAVARIMFERWHDDRSYICRQGETGNELFLVYRGEVEVIRETGGGDGHTLFIAKTGDCIGELAALGDIPRTASLRARGNVELLVIERINFVETLRRAPEMSIRLMKTIVERLAPT